MITMKASLCRFLVLVCSCILFSYAQEGQDPTKFNGGSVLAMAGDGCVALAVDKRFGMGMQVVFVQVDICYYNAFLSSIVVLYV